MEQGKKMMDLFKLPLILVTDNMNVYLKNQKKKIDTSIFDSFFKRN